VAGGAREALGAGLEDFAVRWDNRWEYRWIRWNHWCRDGLFCCDCLVGGEGGGREGGAVEVPASVFGEALERAVAGRLCGRAA
jgi:hypothetical protein